LKKWIFTFALSALLIDSFQHPPAALRKKTLAVLAKNPSTTELIPPKKEALQTFFLEYFIHMKTSKRLYIYFCCKNGGQKHCHLIYCATMCNLKVY
jgi:hypothetical protein